MYVQCLMMLLFSFLFVLQEYVYNRLHFRCVDFTVYCIRHFLSGLLLTIGYLGFSYGWYFTFIQGFVYLALLYLQGFTTKQMVNPWKTYVKLSAVLMGSHGLTKGSLAFLNYPAQIMFKSTKVCMYTSTAYCS